MDEQIITRALDAVERMMRMFQIERILYLMCAMAAFGVLLYAAYMMFEKDGVTEAELALIFGASGLTTYSSRQLIVFLNRTFALIDDIVRKLSGVGPPQ